MSGTFIGAAGSTITLGHGAAPDTTHAVAIAATITLNNNPCTMAELRDGDSVDLDADQATTVKARR